MDTLVAFVTWLLLESDVTHGSAKRYICHVKTLARQLGAPAPELAGTRLDYALRSFRKLRPSSQRPPRVPITVKLLQSMLEYLGDDLRDIAVKAILTVGVYGLFRSGELTYKKTTAPEDILLRSDVTWELDNSVAAIHLRVSKTDPMREGITVRVYANQSPTCPVSALQAWWDAAVDQTPRAPLFQLPDGRPFPYTVLNKCIQDLACDCGLERRSIGGHSLRIGGATTLAQMGLPAHVIQSMGRWRSLSYQLYLRLSEQYKTDLSELMSREPSRVSGFFGGMSVQQACCLSLDNIDTVPVFRSRPSALPV